MSKSLLALTFGAKVPAYRQVTAKVRDLILDGDLPPGVRLPSSQELALEWGLNPRTVHEGMLPLVREGLLHRVPKRGTFVRQREVRLTHIGVYYSQDIWARGGSLFLQSLHGAIKEQLNARAVETDVWVDPRALHEEHEPWEPFVRAAERREFQALIVPATDSPHIQWQSKLPIPVAYNSSAHLPNTVHLDYEQFAELSLRRLADQGCRSVGLIASICPDVEDADGRPYDGTLFIGRFMQVAGDLGLSVRNEWMRLPKHLEDLHALSPRLFGYREFQKLWAYPTRPDGLVVMDDVVASGVITAVLEQGGGIPKELKLVLHKNENIELLCPLPATFLVSSEREMAQALIEQVEKQFHGEVVRSRQVGFALTEAVAPGIPPVRSDISERTEKPAIQGFQGTTNKRKGRNP